MRASEQIAVFILVAVIVITYAAAGKILLHRVLVRREDEPAEPGRFMLWLRRAVLLLAAVGTLCIVYGRFIEPYRLEVTHIRIPTRKLPEGARPIRIVHVSDFHCDPKARLEERLPDVIAAQKPDFIVFTGDTVNSVESLPLFRKTIKRIAEIAPTFTVTGNWDAWYWNDLDLFGGTGVRELNDIPAKVPVEDTEVCVVGIPAFEMERIDKLLAAVPEDAFTVFLYHYPDEIYRVAETGRIDLYCAGHTHGGQVAMPLYGALVTLSEYGKRFESGLYRVEDTWLYVNRGIGMEGGALPRVRFFARPEVTVIEVVPEDQKDEG